MALRCKNFVYFALSNLSFYTYLHSEHSREVRESIMTLSLFGPKSEVNLNTFFFAHILHCSPED